MTCFLQTSTLATAAGRTLSLTLGGALEAGHLMGHRLVCEAPVLGQVLIPPQSSQPTLGASILYHWSGNISEGIPLENATEGAGIPSLGPASSINNLCQKDWKTETCCSNIETQTF